VEYYWGLDLWVRRVANDEMGMDDNLINAIWLAAGDRFSWAGLMSIVQSTKFVRATALYHFLCATARNASSFAPYQWMKTYIAAQPFNAECVM
jgi:hypothetical protein